MATDDEQETSAEQPTPEAVHHETIGEMSPLRDLPEDDEDEAREEDEIFEPGPSFGEGV